MWMIEKLFSKILAIIFPSSCIRCKKEGEPFCSKCLSLSIKPIDTPHPFTQSCYSFKDPYIKKSIHLIKYFHRKDLVYPLTDALVEKIKEQKYQGILVPIPMPKLRIYIRGYNQAEVIAKALSKKCNLHIDATILARSGKTKRQVATRSRRERLNNQKNAFTVKKDVTGQSLILVDDVTTTGSTLYEARKILLKSGAKKVTAITIAH